MRPKPSAHELLETARKAMCGETLAALPEERRYEALMIANAIAIAGRILERGEVPEREELASLARLMGDKDPAIPADPAMVRERSNALYGRLADELRAGKIAPGGARHSSVFAHLRRTVVERLHESNPKALPQE
ncbi:MAG: hypothetical protein EXR02_04745 [Rhodospirillales bacterium]|nr:hypothetical protein [Rhodospirillales bacterium]